MAVILLLTTFLSAAPLAAKTVMLGTIIIIVRMQHIKTFNIFFVFAKANQLLTFKLLRFLCNKKSVGIRIENKKQRVFVKLHLFPNIVAIPIRTIFI